jgi:hypothetical protein
MAAGYFIALLTVGEGIIVLCSITGRLGPSWDILSYMSEESPLFTVQRAFLWVLGVADILLAAVAVFGLLTARCALPLGLHRIQDPETSSLCVIALIPWRLLVAVVLAPWLGTVLAFSTLPTVTKVVTVVAALAYLALNFYFLWTLVLAAQVVWQGACRLQQRLVRNDGEERRARVQQLRYLEDIGYEEPPYMFGRIPVDFTIFVYALVLLAVGSWGFLHVSATGHTLGGWAALSSVVAQGALVFDGTPVMLEMSVYLLCAAAALVGLLGMLVQRVATVFLDDYSESLLKTRRKCAYVLAFFFIANCLRFVLLIPVTGMAVAASNVCGFYLRALSDKIAYKTWYSNSIVPMHCTLDDTLSLSVMATMLALDAYLLWGSWQVSQRCYSGYLRQLQLLSFDGSSSYGAAQK